MTESATTDDRERKPCPRCAELVVVGASVCRFCGAKLEWVSNGTPYDFSNADTPATPPPSAREGVRRAGRALVAAGLLTAVAGIMWRALKTADVEACEAGNRLRASGGLFDPVACSASNVPLVVALAGGGLLLIGVVMLIGTSDSRR